jgi:hypothetical protein|tara:strand:+ start:958 stop:1152 length:195 start_codon:yes stop_codon:yes gene_type:complete
MEVTDRKRGIVKNIDLIAVAEELHGVLDDIDTTKEKEKEVPSHAGGATSVLGLGPKGVTPAGGI